MRKKILVKIILIFIFILSPFLILTSFDLAIQNEYSAYYYAELSSMYNKLKNTKNKKIIIIGNSNVCFGVESRLFEELISSDDFNYEVINFGLYGSIGTKAMLDLTKNYIKKDDIVILIPEEYQQSMSLYFSAKEMWYALDSNRSMFNDLDSRSKEALIGNYFDYVSKKYKSYKSNVSFEGLGVYAKSSFDDNCDMTNCNRDYNIMFNDYDENNPIDLNEIVLEEDFINYLNEYNDYILKKGASMYYSFSPMNKEAVLNNDDEIDSFYIRLKDKLNFPIISDINKYIMDKEWFYDSNYHLNTSGMKLRTFLLVEDLKNELSITTKTRFIMFEKPKKPETTITGVGDNRCSDCFIYEKNGNYYKIVGIKDEYKEKEELIVPYSVDGYYINEFTKDVFSYNKNIKKIIVQDNIKRIYDNSFYGCEALEGIYLEHNSPSEISVGFNLLTGTKAGIFIDNKIKTSFLNDYFFGAYQERIFGYEKD